MKKDKEIYLMIILIITSFSISSFASTGESNQVVKSIAQKAQSKKVIITGSNRGLGLGWTKYYLKAGYFVMATCRKPEKATDLIELVEKYGDQLQIEQLDVTSETSFDALSKKLKSEGQIFDIAISNAAVAVGEQFGEWTLENFEFILRVNIIGTALFDQMIKPFLIKGSKLIQVSSGMGSIQYNVNPKGPLDAYAISKAGVNMLTKRISARFEEEGIIVVAINPGWVKTEMGGKDAPETVEFSIQKMASTVENLTMENSGGFYNKDGEVLKW
ncbi:MAG: SDR family oxidoreductase [Reichenbachiella sp.]